MTITKMPPVSIGARRAAEREAEAIDLAVILSHPAHVKLAQDLADAVSAKEAAQQCADERLELLTNEQHASSALAARNDELLTKIATADRRLADEMQQAAMAADRDRLALNDALVRLDRAKRDLKTMTEDRDNILDALGTALLELDGKFCPTCDGAGTIQDTRDGYGGPNDETPPQIPCEYECEDCRGIGREWL